MRVPPKREPQRSLVGHRCPPTAHLAESKRAGGPEPPGSVLSHLTLMKLITFAKPHWVLEGGKSPLRTRARSHAGTHARTHGSSAGRRDFLAEPRVFGSGRVAFQRCVGIDAPEIPGSWRTECISRFPPAVGTQQTRIFLPRFVVWFGV